MEIKVDHLYNELLEELNSTRASSLPENECAECLYQVAFTYWRRLRLHIEGMELDEQEEIKFFKDIKPRFTAHLEFALLMNQGLLFQPGDPIEKLEYWKIEEKRYHRFMGQHSCFILYYKSGVTDKDKDYFLRGPVQPCLSSIEIIYADEDCRSPRDYLVRGLLAHELYKAYVGEKLKALLPFNT